MGGDGVFIFLPSTCHQNGERQKPGDDGDSQMAKRGVWLSWLEWICVLEQWADASGEPRQLSQKAAVVSPL